MQQLVSSESESGALSAEVNLDEAMFNLIEATYALKRINFFDKSLQVVITCQVKFVWVADYFAVGKTLHIHTHKLPRV